MPPSAKNAGPDAHATRRKPAARKKQHAHVASPPESLMIVGIGASAGGLEAFTTFFSHMPADSGLAFVLVQHLAPDHDSMLSDLLGRATGMPVREAVDGMRVEPDHVYVIPPDATLTVVEGILRVHKPAPPREHRWPINSFFVSLAEDQGDHAACVVLSGTGSDGAQGLRAIKSHGGLALAQAGFDHVVMTGMPASAVATGLVDAVLPVEEMPARLLAYREQKRHADRDREPPSSERDDQVLAICQLLRAQVGHDFSQYKKKTLARRIQRRMLVTQTESMTDYIDHLHEHPQEHEFLFREFLIGVTGFFRNPEAFEALQKRAIPSILADKSRADTLRVWVPGCSTGEEAYSIAIALCEMLDDRHGPRVQIFATDIDEHAISLARTGRYRAPLKGVSNARLERWFRQDHGDYCVIKKVREMCIFSPHSVVRDPPFSRMDLVSCRNLMIYMNAQLQSRLMHSFHYSLRPGGYLLLGGSERLVSSGQLFAEVDKKQRLYMRRGGTRTHPRDFSNEQPLPDRMAGRAPSVPPHGIENTLDQRAMQALEPWLPAHMVINARHEILHFGGHAGRYLKPLSGAASLNLFQLLGKPLRGIVRAAVLQASSEGAEVVREESGITVNGRERSLRVVVRPLQDGSDLCVVAFIELEPAAPAAVPTVGDKPDREQARIQELEKELSSTRAQLRAAVDLHEIANEELKSANEEYQSVNAELQSTNEELETSTEEMQSINEELQTVNAELNSKNEVLRQNNDDVRNLLDSTRIGIVFLDSDLRIRSFTPAMSELFHLRSGDRGRPITEISPLVAYPQLDADVAHVLREMTVTERLLHAEDTAQTFLLRMRPYVTVDNVVNGVVLTFVDVTETQLRNSEHARLAAIVNSSHDAIFGFSLDDHITSWNPAAEKIFGLSSAQIIGKPLGNLLPAESSTRAKMFFVDRAFRQHATEFEMTWVQPDGTTVPLDMGYSPVRDDDGRMIAGKIIARDITDRHRAEQHTQMMMGELNHRVKNTLATVQAIALQTLANAPGLAEFRKSFINRLLALSNTHNLLASNAWSGASITDVIVSELAPFQQGEKLCVTLHGEPFTLSTKMALALSMGLHELTTNAVKYGALSVPEGQVTVSWEILQVEDRSLLHLIWRESGGPPVSPSKHKGFGSRLITDGLPYELNGKVALEYPQSGVICTIDAPLKREESS